MKIIITEPELTQIVRNHVLSTVQLHNGANIQIDFSATRGTDGVTASIDIPYVGVTGLDLSPQTPQYKSEEAIPPGTVKAEKVEKGSPAKTKAAPSTVEEPPKGIFADAKAEADAAVAGTAVAEERTASDTAAAVEGSAQTDAAPAPTADAGVSLFP